VSCRLSPDPCRFGLGADFATALAVVVQGKSVAAAACLSRLDEALAGHADTGPDALRGGGSILAILEVLTQHADYFDAGAVICSDEVAILAARFIASIGPIPSRSATESVFTGAAEGVHRRPAKSWQNAAAAALGCV
jgi:hypothetical protein